MPFTPLHLGVPLVLGYLLRRRLHWPTFIAASVAPDLEPAIVLFLGVRGYPLHGYLHTFLSSAVLGFALGYVMWRLGKRLDAVYRSLMLVEEGRQNLGSYAGAGILGSALHIALDAPLYVDIKPFYPLQWNPLLGCVPEESVIAASGFLTVTGLLMYLVHALRSTRGLLPATLNSRSVSGQDLRGL